MTHGQIAGVIVTIIVVLIVIVPSYFSNRKMRKRFEAEVAKSDAATKASMEQQERICLALDRIAAALEALKT